MNKPPVAAKEQAGSKKVPRRLRRKLIVDARFQLRRLMPVVAYVVLLVALLGLVVLYPLHYQANQDPNPVIRAVLQEQVLALHVRLWPAIALAGVLAGIYTLAYSTRLAGPLHKLRVVLLQLAEGNSVPIRFRRGDELREFEDVMNRLARRIESLSSGNARQISQIQQRIKWLRTRLESQDLPKAQIGTELDAILIETGLQQVQTQG